MVTVTDYRIRQNAEGENFVALMLQGDLTMVQSQETGRFYATTRKCSVTSTFSEETAKSLVGTRIPGQIVRVECEPYDYTIEETGEVVQLSHHWVYSPEEAASPHKPPLAPVPPTVESENGVEQLVA